MSCLLLCIGSRRHNSCFPHTRRVVDPLSLATVADSIMIEVADRNHYGVGLFDFGVDLSNYDFGLFDLWCREFKLRFRFMAPINQFTISVYSILAWQHHSSLFLGNDDYTQIPKTGYHKSKKGIFFGIFTKSNAPNTH